jgi:hypothetical protein
MSASPKGNVVFEILGIAGVAISVAAYVPQVVHLGREHCSAGVSSRAWAMWLVSSLLIGALALHRREPVFIALQVINLTSISVTLLLARRYRGMVCEHHANLAPSRPASTTSGKFPAAVNVPDMASAAVAAPELAPAGSAFNIVDERSATATTSTNSRT